MHTFSLRGKKVLVTGSSGFIGSHLVQRLITEGARVRALCHYRADPRLHNLEFLTADEKAAVEIVRGDIEDPSFVRTCVHDCEVVFHLAALIGIPYSYVAPASFVSTNVCGTLNVLEACRAENTCRLIHTSTSECYGSAIYIPIDERHTLQAQSPYAASKIAADKFVESYHKSFGVRTVTVRPFNTFGPRQSARAVIPTIISQFLQGVPTLRLGALTPVRDFTYVSDTVNGLICAARCDTCEGETINLGTGRGYTIGDLVQAIGKILGVSPAISTSEDRRRPDKSEVQALISDNRKARALLNWEPAVSLETGLIQVIDFIRSNRDLFDPLQYAI